MSMVHVEHTEFHITGSATHSSVERSAMETDDKLPISAST